MRSIHTLAASVALLAGVAVLPQRAQAQTLVWQDNFNGPSIDGNKWIHDVGNGCQIGLCGWGNGEMQYYTSRPENARIANGSLIIARRERRLRHRQRLLPEPMIGSAGSHRDGLSE